MATPLSTMVQPPAVADRETMPMRRDRRSPAFVRWVQSALNRIGGYGLTVDGRFGARTGRAVRAFQRRRGLVGDGVVGPATERALIAAGAGRPPAAAAPHPGPATTLPWGSAPATSTAALRANLVRIATREWLRWGRGTIKEHEPRMRAVLLDYWVTGTGRRLSGPRWWSARPWSAAFISWTMRQSGAGNAFPYSALHAVYISRAKRHRLTNSPNPFKAYRVSEVAPRLGDLVCRSRAGSGATYDTIRPDMATHCDIVTTIEPGRLLTIGGNVKQSVWRTPVRTNAAGYVTQPGYFAVIRVG